MSADRDINGASVKFPPPIVFILFMLIAYLMHSNLALEINNTNISHYGGYFLVTLGFSIILSASISFKRAQTDIKPWKPTTKIISSGIFAYSRNPIYLAFCIITIGIGLIFNSLWIALSFIPSIVIIFFIAVRKEEIYLENKFGQEYLRYKAKVRRWF